MPHKLNFDESSNLNFTHDIKDLIKDLIPNVDEQDIDPEKMESYLYEDSSEIIYHFLMKKYSHHGFCDHLKRYIYREAAMTGDFNSIPDEVFRSIIVGAFRDNLTDFSFYPTKAHSKEVVSDWLRRKVVSRETVLLLGFGLKMKPEDIRVLLHKGLHEAYLDPKEPLEAVCSYCFRKGYTFPRFKKLWEQFDPGRPGFLPMGNSMDDTFRMQEKLNAIETDDELMAYLFHLPLSKGSKRQSLTARREFDRLYSSVQDGLLKRNMKDETAVGEWESDPAKPKGKPKLDGNAEIENILYAFVPKTESNNYAPLRNSTLKDLFYEKRLNRQHIGEIQRGKAPVTRFDLITMSFLAYDLKRNSEANIMQNHYDAFIRETNEILKKCNMDELYEGNPYESFIMLCMQTESPIEVYSEIWGMSYGEL